MKHDQVIPVSSGSLSDNGHHPSASPLDAIFNHITVPDEWPTPRITDTRHIVAAEAVYDQWPESVGVSFTVTGGDTWSHYTLTNPRMRDERDRFKDAVARASKR